MKIILNETLNPQIQLLKCSTYIVKIPMQNLQVMAKQKQGIILRYWYLTTCVFTTDWQ